MHNSALRSIPLNLPIPPVPAIVVIHCIAHDPCTMHILLDKPSISMALLPVPVSVISCAAHVSHTSMQVLLDSLYESVAKELHLQASYL